MARVEYTAASQLRRPRQFLRSSWHSLLASRGVGWRLFLRNIRSQHRLSALGYLWLIIPWMAQVLLWSFLNASNIINTGSTGMPYVAYVIIGVFFWQIFVDALQAPLRTLGNATSLISRVSFPVESLLVAAVGELVTNLIARSIVLVPVLAWYDIAPGWTMLLVPLAMASLALMGYSIGLIIAPFGMLYQDVGRLVPVVTQFLFLVTPAAFAVPTEGLATRIDRLNPISPVMRAGREWLSGGTALLSPAFVGVTVGAALLLVAGWILLRLSLPHLVDRISV